MVAQAQAIQGIAGLEASEETVHVLSSALRNPRLFWRLRADAALALGYTASESTAAGLRGADELVDFFR